MMNEVEEFRIRVRVKVRVRVRVRGRSEFTHYHTVGLGGCSPPRHHQSHWD